MKIKAENSGLRLDVFLVGEFPDKTRGYIQKVIKDGAVQVKSIDSKNGGGGRKRSDKSGDGVFKIVTKVGYVVKAGDTLEVNFPEAKSVDIKATKIPLNILFEDEDIIVIDKPSGLVVHPSESGGHTSDSLVNALMYHCGKSFKGISGGLRPGIVHRLDKETSGVLVVAKNDLAMQSLMKQFSGRKVAKKYVALVCGHVSPAGAQIDSPIGRSIYDRKKMSISSEEKGRKAVTEYKVRKFLKDANASTSFRDGVNDDISVGKYSLLDINLKTGRTHQIRVHMEAIGYPVVGDIVYGKEKINKYFTKEFGLKRQFLHAASLTITHPGTDKKITFSSDLPSDLSKALKGLKQS